MVRTPVEILRDAISEIHKPAAVQLAESRVCQLRDARSELAEQQRGAAMEHRNRPAPNEVPSAGMVRLAAELDALDGKINQAGADLDNARRDWAPKINAALRPHRVAAGAALGAAVRLIDEARELLWIANDFAARNGAEPVGQLAHFIDVGLARGIAEGLAPK